ncbi:MAG: DUF4149 domain-containing protein [Mariprofundaceae bacterium]|nr:DUF4149 domain-containing protein [Mariprofundaceae bacterium]
MPISLVSTSVKPISVHCIRMGAIRLCVAMILGLLLVPAYIVAPILFAQADSSAQAGMLAGHIFHMANIGVLFLAAAVASFWVRSCTVGYLNWALLLLTVLLVSVNEFAVSPLMQALKDSAGAIDLLDKDDPQRVSFGIYHGISAVFHLLASLMSALLVAFGGVLGGASCAGDKDKTHGA